MSRVWLNLGPSHNMGAAKFWNLGGCASHDLEGPVRPAQRGTASFPRMSSVLEGNSSATVQSALLSFDFYVSFCRPSYRTPKALCFFRLVRSSVRACMHTCVRKRQYQIGLQLTSSSCNRLCNQIISTITVIMMTMKVVFLASSEQFGRWDLQFGI